MEEQTDTPPPPQWRPLAALERRALGVLIEKAKTTPDAYPLSLNGLKTGCNQKSNRDPVMNVDEDSLEETLDRLREMGATALIQGSGRVQKYRHFGYQWLGVEKIELAVMAELLLRGAQTEGELRGRAARMDPVPDLAALRPVLDSLKQKNLIISLTPPGRGHVITHNLYPPAELERLQARYKQQSDTSPAPAQTAAAPAASGSPSLAASGAGVAPADGPTNRPPSVTPSAAPVSAAPSLADAQLRQLVDLLQQQVTDLTGRLAEMEDMMLQMETNIDELMSFKQAVEG